MVYLVTGCAGFIGWRVAEFLLKDNHKVVGLDEVNRAYDPLLKNWRLERLKGYPNFSFYQVDLADLESLRRIFAGNSFSGVIHLAARAGVRQSVENPWVYVSANVNGTLNLLHLMQEYGPKKMVLASTSSLYAGQNPPYHEELKVDQPLSPYAATKKASELLSYTYHHLYDLDISVVRYFTVYGPAGRPDMSIFRFIKWIMEETPIQIYGDGTQARDFTYVDDVAEGTILALKPLGYEIVNLGGGRNPISINDVLEILEEYLGKKAKRVYLPFHKADLKITWAEIGKAKELLGWWPKVDLKEGLKRTVEWALENRELIERIKV